MKRICTLLLCLPLLLAGCGGTQESETIQEHYESLERAEVSTDITCHLSGESREFSLDCKWDDGDAEVTVTAPPELAGLTANVSGEELELTYDGLILPAGTLENLSPANCVPWLLWAIRSGYVLEEGTERLGERDCRRVAFDTTGPDGEKVLCTVWFDGETRQPLYAEFTQDGQLTLSAVIRAFSAQWAAEQERT